MTQGENLKVHTVRVFTDSSGKFGNPVSIVFDEGRQLDSSKRQAITRETGHDETVFVNDADTADISIFNPMEEVQFAGHAVLGAAWVLSKTGSKTEAIDCSGSKVPAWRNGYLTWIRTNLDIMPSVQALCYWQPNWDSKSKSAMAKAP